MKKNLKPIIVIIIVLVAGFMMLSTVNYLSKSRKIDEQVAIVPQFSFTTLEGETFSNRNLKDSLSNIIINLFSPDCEHCQHMAMAITHHLERLKNWEILMVTPFSDSNTIARFVTKYRIDSFPNLHLLIDKEANVFKIFGSSVVPTFFIYKENKLVKKIKGETKIENLFN